MIALTILVFSGIFLLTLPYLRGGKFQKEKWVFGVFFAGAFVLCLMNAVGVKLPSPLMQIDSFMKAIGLSYPS